MSAIAPRDTAHRPSNAIGGTLIRAALTLVLGVAACSTASERAIDELVRQDGIFLDPETLEPFSGLAFATFERGPGHKAVRAGYEGPFSQDVRRRRLSMRETFENGVKHGRYEWFFENGQLFEEGTYVKGTLDGPYRAFWDTGELYEEGTYRRGEYDGARRWYLGGRLIELVTYDHGVVDGLYERYLEDGTLDLKGMLSEGEPCGMWIEGDRMIAYPYCEARVTE